MMTWAPTESQKTIFTLLSTDSALITLLGSAKVYDAFAVPQDIEYPYVTINLNPMNDRGNHTDEGVAFEPQINVWHRSPERGALKVQQIQKRIDELVHNQDICIEGWNIIVCRRTLVNILPEPDGVTLHGIQRFKLWLGEI